MVTSPVTEADRGAPSLGGAPAGHGSRPRGAQRGARGASVARPRDRSDRCIAILVGSPDERQLGLTGVTFTLNFLKSTPLLTAAT